MNRSEVVSLLLEILEEYPQFDTSDKEIDRHFKYLKDFKFEDALANIDQHIKTKGFPPKISEIRGQLGEQIDRQRSKDASQAHFDQLDEWEAKSAPPPPGLREKIYDLLR